MVALLCSCPSSVIGSGTPQRGSNVFARISFPAAPLINPDEGTYEILVRLNFDPNHVAERQSDTLLYFLVARDKINNEYNSQILFRYRTNWRQRKSAGASMLHNVLGTADTARLLSLGGQLGGVDGRVSNDILGLEEGDLVHLAFTWKYMNGAYDFKVYLDGEEVVSRRGRQTERLEWGDEPYLWIGSPYYMGALGDVYAIAISDCIRTPEQLRKAANSFRFERDESHRLLEDFSSLPVSQIGRVKLEGGGLLEGAYLVIETPHGKAVRMNAIEN